MGASATAFVLASEAEAATIQVTNNNDSGAGSLRQAVEAANTTKAADVVTFAPNVTGTITLSSSINAKYDTTIDGPGADVLTVRTTAISGADTLTASNLASFTEVQNFEVEGLRIVSEDNRAFVGFAGIDSVTIRNCELTGNSVFGGGGIADLGVADFRVIDSRITGSTAEISGAGIEAENSKLTITGSQVTGNANLNDDPGGGLYATDSEVNIVDSRIEGNSSPAGGGGIAVFDPAGGRTASLSITNSLITGNDADLEGGGIFTDVSGPTELTGSTVSGNSSTMGGGGGIYIGYSGSVAVDSSLITGNDAATSGGGIWAFAPLGSFAVRNTTVSGNSASVGGGIDWTNYFDEPGTVANSTIVGNTATADGGGIYRYGFDGVGSNFQGPDDLVVSSTVVAGNSVPTPSSTSAPDLGQPDLASGSFIVDHSLIGSGAGGATITDAGANKLDAGVTGVAGLADNGGPVRTMLPIADGPLVDAGTANGLATDGRGLARTAQKPAADSAGSDGTDIGAVEVQDEELISPSASAKKKQKAKGKRVKIVVEVGAGEVATATAVGSVKLGRKKIPLGDQSGAIAPGVKSKLTLRPKSKKGSKQIAKVLKRGKKARAVVEVTIADGSGHSEAITLPVKLKGG